MKQTRMEIIMITVENLSFSYPKKDLYDNVSLNIEKGEHCVLIGTSGSGKTTLIDIITGRNKYLYDGEVTVDPSCKIGFTSQFYDHDRRDITVFDYIAEKFIELQQGLDLLCEKMAEAEDIDAVMEEYQNALDQFDAIGGNDYHNLIMKKLNQANLGGHANLSVAKVSGGEFKLIQLIKEMISGQDLLIMDEPDVFLDFDNLNSLKHLINGHKGTLLVITHNRYLLNQCFNKVIHLENTKLQQFEGRYSQYNLSLLEQKIELQELALADAIELERNEKLIDDLRELATENSDAMFGKTLKARVRFHQRLLEKQVKEPFIYVRTPDYSFLSKTREETEETMPVITAENYQLSYENKLLQDVNFTINYGDKVAVIGGNGTGKTSLLRAIAGKTSPEINLDDNAKVCYLSQLQNETLTEENTIYDEFFDLGFESYDEIENYLSHYSFEKEVLTSKISSLSGGEKNTLQMAKIASAPADLLILDEPSSHLDIYCQVALEQAIKDFKGTVVMVSHDFYFIANCMDYLLIIENKTLRRMSNRKFRQMIYAKHFDKDYLMIQEKYTLVINDLEKAIVDNNFALARKLHSEAVNLDSQMS